MCRERYTASEAIYQYIMLISDFNMHYSPKCPRIRGPITPEQAEVIRILNKRVKKIKSTYNRLYRSMSACYILVAMMHCFSGPLEIAHAVQTMIAFINVANLTDCGWYRANTLFMSVILAYISNWSPEYTAVCVTLNLAGCGISYYARAALQI